MLYMCLVIHFTDVSMVLALVRLMGLKPHYADFGKQRNC